MLAAAPPVSSAGPVAATQEAPRPATATLVSPIGVTSSANQTFRWNAVSDATQYYLWIDDSTGRRFEKWYDRSVVGCPSGTGQCAITVETPLTPGTITWWVQTWNAAGGYGFWSSPATFTLQPLAIPTLIGPSGYTPKPAFQFRWNAVPGATHHDPGASSMRPG